MNQCRPLIIASLTLLFLGALAAGFFKWRGFRATSMPSVFETIVARQVRHFAIPGAERRKVNPYAGDSLAVEQGRDIFVAQCATCHGVDGHGRTPIGANVYPRAADLQADATRKLSDGEIHYFIQNGIQLSGMPALNSSHSEADAESWKVVSYVRSFQPLSPREQLSATSTSATAHYTGSQSCQKCHADI